MICAMLAAGAPAAVVPASADAATDLLIRHLKQAQAELKTLESRFTQTRRFVHFNETETRSGRLSYKRSRGVRLEYQGDQKDDREVLVAAKKAVELWTPRTKQLQRFALPDTAVAASTAVPFLPASDGQGLDPRYVRRLEPQDGLEVLLVTSPPGGPTALYVEKRLYIDRSDWLPRRVELKEASDDLVTFVFTELKRNTKLDDDLFTLKVPRDTEIIEHKEPLKY